MEKIIRTKTPEWLKEKWEEWGKDWETQQTRQKNPKFTWRRHQKKGYKDLIDELTVMTQDHCSFCDAYPLGPVGPTIEHFKPKSLFYLDAFKWENLFLSCHKCQTKKDKFNDGLLKPDEDYYNFDAYFDIEWISGRLIPNWDASEDDQKRADITIKLYRLNEHSRPEARRRELNKYIPLQKKIEINLFPYRFYLKRGIQPLLQDLPSE